MKQNKHIYVLLLLCCIVFAGCDKYLDITPKGKRLLSTVADYDQWLNSPDLVYGWGSAYCLAAFLGDNVDFPNVTTPPVAITEVLYTWQPQLSTDLAAPPTFWGEHYGRINMYNTVLVGIDDATGGTSAQKKALKAEALLGRAMEYFFLVNEYGKPYDSTTAAQDPGVPFVTSNDVTQTVPARSSVAEVHKRIIDDLNAAIPDLPNDNSANRYRGSKAAAYSMLARIYLYARNYTDARKYAEMALADTRAVMINLNGPLPLSNILSVRQDAIYCRMIIANAPPSLEFLRSFSMNTDLRLRKFYTSTDGYNFTTRGATSYFPAAITPVFTYENTATSVQEMKLIIAECAARVQELPVALQQLNDIRINRLPAASYTPYNSADPEEVFQEVLKERNRELPFTGLRWFDMRRFDKENRMGTVTRLNAQGAVVATLPPHSPRYTLQIPVQVLSYNPGMEQNP